VISQQLFLRYYPTDSHNGTKAFYGWLRDHLSRSDIVLNIGAGPATGNSVRSLKGEVRKVIGVDIDPLVLSNVELDEAHVMHESVIPLADNSIDIAYADYVLEHVEDPTTFLKEVRRVLKPGAPFLFRTPNLWFYVSLVSFLTPQWLHRLIANPMRGLPPDAHEPWPTFYRLNTRRTIRKKAIATGFNRQEFRMFEGEPSYLMFNRAAFMVGLAYERTVNATEALCFMRANILGRLS
jgi:ubiquinone/menaquinone biosynthesis C-methylase UbiE